ncbi:PD-(D/E)XK nuclease family protein [Roseibacillus persicicus]|uniref:PD-(D/E)XK nuclease family protein n=1 Tax=Roseibacillus persicicus TaxID=454148 RepID=UPI00398AE85C
MAAQQQSELDLFASPRRDVGIHFIGWDRPLLPLAVEFLAQGWQEGPLDLTHLAVVVPTRNASRRLRESLALFAATRNAGVLPPVILNPDDLLSLTSGASPQDESPAPPPATASKAESLLAWIKVLLDTDLETVRNLFPVEPVEKNFSWGLRTARELMQVQSLLGEGAHNTSYAAKVLASHDLEPERWEEFSQLERAFFRQLEKEGRLPRAMLRRQAVESPVLPPECTQLFLIGLPDPPPALIPLVEKIAERLPVQVIVHAPESSAPQFDEWGRPLAIWNDRHQEIPDHAIHQGANPTEQAEKVCERLARYEQPHLVAAVGVPDTEVVAPLQKSLAARGLSSFDPAGEAMSRQGLNHLLRTLRDLVSSRSLGTLRELLRIPGVAEAAGSFQVPDGSSAYPPTAILQAFDKFHEAHLCSTMDEAWGILEHVKDDKGPLTRTLQWTQEALRNLEYEPLEKALPQVLEDIYQHTNLAKDEEFSAAAQLLHRVLDEVAALSFAGQGPTERFQLFLTILEEQVLASKRHADAIELPGWLELAWEDAPHLVVTGCNDGLVPETIQGHPWLPDQARRLLGLRHNATRQARDAYLLASLLASRENDGQVDLIFGRTNSKGDPLRPSRLLLATPPEVLHERVNLLFRDSISATDPLPWKMGWQLTPPAPDPEQFQRISVTAFSSYLNCPFRFYLQHGLKMNALDLERMELNARDFGNVMHDVLEEFAKGGTANSESAREIAECFEDLLSDHLTKKYGTRLSAPLLIQASSMRQRLGWWAHQEAQQRQAGWSILETETYLAPKEDPFRIGGMIIKGKIDRIESHPDEGLRILDFKTKKKPTPVDEAHLRNARRDEDLSALPDWMKATYKGKEKCWTNLQIPLYLLALRDRYPNQPRTAGYVQLGAAMGDVHLNLWEELDAELLESAGNCALGIIENIQNEVFWPPAEKSKFDDFADLLFGDPKSAINAVNLKKKANDEE